MADGILIVDKPAGLTSHDVVARVRRSLRERRVGHTGTLDPFATGVLVVLVGRATRLAQFLAGAEKEYEALIRFGYATDTGDATGARLDTRPTQTETGPRVHPWTERELESALACFRGEIEQVPPMYSAKKIQGQKLYELARRGVEVERAPVRVTIHELEAIPQDGALLQANQDGTQDLRVRVSCSAGTYIRTLAESIGERLGAAAHLAALRRTRAGDFKIVDAVTLDDLKEKTEAGNQPVDLLLPLDAALPGVPFVHLTADEARRALHGMALRFNPEAGAGWPDNGPVGMRDADGHLIAVGFYDAARQVLHPRVVFSPENKH
ncbi:MAG TPA: tRNA pseudouridine(55) synthase TruB [Pyrinomonadaceae bacterium]|nr:tRNA pseudouridine(55) synthase TruB [Pyrinomonadaceae bacterium]